ncbi:hypothetical protein [Geotalea toluenoxydans]|uniref:hypothetical protein n=1 Tax=Geotalea toluenoxydans TaxID=421624 RepID=UPI0006D0005C|nr:hypothetical protein [Geotalea toluenoxydans]
MKINFAELMAQRTDAELIEIVSRKTADYLPEALAEAQAELEKRKLSITQINLANESLDADDAARKAKALIPLSIRLKLWAFFIPKPGNLLIAKTFKAEGHLKKHADVIKWTSLGGCFYVTLISLLFLLAKFGLLK